MVKHTQTIRRLLPTYCLSVFDHFAGLALKGLNKKAFTKKGKKRQKKLKKILINKFTNK